MIKNNVKNVILKTNEFSLTKNILVYVTIIRKIYWKEHDVKATIFRVLRNIHQLYIPSLKITKPNQIKKLFEKINITIPNDGFIFSIDEYKILNSQAMSISNMSVDYSVILNNSLEDLYKIYASDDEYCQAQKETLDAITLLIDRHIKELEKSNRSDREKFISFYKNIKNSKVSSLEEALQRILFFNQILWQTGHALNGFGRLDQILENIYLKDSISKKDTLKLLKNFLKSSHDYFYFKSGALSGDTGQIIVLGGMELNGEYFSNDLTYLFIEALKELQLPDPKIILRYSDEIPRDLMELAVESMDNGIGSPLMSNDNLVVEDLVNFGYLHEDAVNYVVSACWEPAAVGKGFEMNNIGSVVFMEPLNNLLANEDLKSFKTFDLLVNRYGEYLNQYCCNLLDDINKINWENDPIISLFYSECSENHKNIAEGGAKYNNYGLTSVSLSNTINSLINIKKFVFEEKKFSLEELNQYRLDNFENEEILKLLKSQNLKFGMDNEEVIDLTNKITLFANNAFKSKKTRFGGNFKFGLSSPGYISAGGNAPASFDGRLNGEEFHTHISYDDNTDYTELMRFASKLDYTGSRFNGNVVDFMVSPSFSKNNFDKFTDFIMLSLKMGVFEMQLNVVSSETLIKAKANPDAYPNLIVRVWGFSAYFRDLPENYQDVLIKRALENEGKITNIQRFSLHDGPGIRTTVFMKGCNLTCPWCGNPECVYGKYSKTISSDDLKKEILKDMAYYELNDGGVTFSGGEPLLQIDKLEDLLESLNINICFETALMTSKDKVKTAMKYADEFIIDIKILDEKKCFNVLGGDINRFYENVELVLNSEIPVTFRIPLALDYTLTDSNVDLILNFLDKYKVDKLEIFKIHNFADEKYKKLNREHYYNEVDDETVNKFYELVNDKADCVEILKY